jgi:DNA-binding MarR family transcriptional regulator
MTEIQLPPVQELIMDNLAARHRLGERTWTFTSTSGMGKALRKLEELELITFKRGVVEKSYLASLTSKGREEWLDASYQAPNALTPDELATVAATLREKRNYLTLLADDGKDLYSTQAGVHAATLTSALAKIELV